MAEEWKRAKRKDRQHIRSQKMFGYARMLRKVQLNLELNYIQLEG